MIANRLILLALGGLLFFSNSRAVAADSASAAPAASSKNQTVGTLYEEIEKLVKDYYPKAKVAINDSSIHFEHKARMRLSVSQRLELAPDADGIVGDIKLVNGSYRGLERVPGENDQRFHIILTMAPYNKSADAHIFTRMYYPPGTTPEFLVQFKSLVNGFASQAIPQASTQAPASSASPQPAATAQPPGATAQVPVAASTTPALSISPPPAATPDAAPKVAATIPQATGSPAYHSAPQFAKGKLRKRSLEDGVSIMLPADATKQAYAIGTFKANCYRCSDFPHGEFRLICISLPENSTLSTSALDTLCAELGRAVTPQASIRGKHPIKIKEMSGLSLDLAHEGSLTAGDGLQSLSQPAAADLKAAVQTLGSDMSQWLKSYRKDAPLTAKTNAPWGRMQVLVSGPKVYVLIAAGRPVWLGSNVVTQAFESLEINSITNH